MELPSASARSCSDPCPGPCSGCPDRVVCRCLKVAEETIVDAIVTLGLRTVKQLTVATGAGDGCTCCHRELHELIEVHAEVRLEARVPSTL
jgi:bacterioferritin-associated ferredoxin